MARLDKLRALMEKNGLSHVLLSDSDDIFYYTGYRTFDSAFLLVGMNSAKLFVFSVDNGAVATGIDVVFMKNLNVFKQLKKCKRVGYDSISMKARLYTRLRSFGIRMKDASELIKEPRMIKEQREIDLIKAGIKLAGSIFDSLRISGSESDIASDIDVKIRKLGCFNAFETIVSSGKNGYFIHHIPSKKVIAPSDMVIVDFGVRLNGYCTDNTRTFCKAPGKMERTIMDDVKNMQGMLIDGIYDGATVESVQKIYEDAMKRNGYKIMHSFGHGIGISVHEKLGTVLKEGMVLTVEPGVYINNFGGCRIEDIVLVRKQKAKVFSLKCC